MVEGGGDDLTGFGALLRSYLVACFVGVGVVAVWRGIWHLMDGLSVSAWLSLLIGMVGAGLHFGAMGRGLLSQSWLAQPSRLAEYAAAWLYMGFYIVAVVMYWRGVWYLLSSAETSLGLSPVVGPVLCFLLGALVLMCCGALASSLAAPAVVLSDRNPMAGLRLPDLPAPPLFAGMGAPPMPDQSVRKTQDGVEIPLQVVSGSSAARAEASGLAGAVPTGGACLAVSGPEDRIDLNRGEGHTENRTQGPGASGEILGTAGVVSSAPAAVVTSGSSV